MILSIINLLILIYMNTNQKREHFMMLKEAFKKDKDLSFGKRALYFGLGVFIEPIIEVGEALNKVGIETGENFDEDYYKSKSDKKEYECIGIMQKLVEQINKKLSKEEQITVYQLDRMIWLVCSGNFFLDNTKGYKDRYLKSLAEI